jgi:hypothetical protein
MATGLAGAAAGDHPLKTLKTAFIRGVDLLGERGLLDAVGHRSTALFQFLQDVPAALAAIGARPAGVADFAEALSAGLENRVERSVVDPVAHADDHFDLLLMSK